MLGYLALKSISEEWQMKSSSLTGITCIVVCLTIVLQAEVRLAHHFGGNMVLQQGRSAKVWGWAKPGAKMELSFAGQTMSAVADADGAWKVALEPLAVDDERDGRLSARTPEGVRYLWTGWAKPLCSLYDGQNQPVTSFSFPVEIQ